MSVLQSKLFILIWQSVCEKKHHLFSYLALPGRKRRFGALLREFATKGGVRV